MGTSGVGTLRTAPPALRVACWAHQTPNIRTSRSRPLRSDPRRPSLMKAGRRVRIGELADSGLSLNRSRGFGPSSVQRPRILLLPKNRSIPAISPATARSSMAAATKLRMRNGPSSGKPSGSRCWSQYASPCVTGSVLRTPPWVAAALRYRSTFRSVTYSVPAPCARCCLIGPANSIRCMP